MMTIIVTSYSTKRLPGIERLLESLKSQSIHDYEIIYVVEGSEDLVRGIRDAMNELGVKGRILKSSKGLGLAGARNEGLREASGEIVCFIDDDVILSRGWCSAIVEAFATIPEISGATGPAYPIWSKGQMNWLPFQLDWLIGCTGWFTSNQPVEVTNVWGMNMCFSRRVLRSPEGFLGGSGMAKGRISGTVGEDVEISARIRRGGGHLYYLPHMAVYNSIDESRLSFAFILERSVRVGRDRGFFADWKSVVLASAPESRILVSLGGEVFGRLTGRQHLSFGERARTLSVTIVALLGVSIGFFAGRLEPHKMCSRHLS